MSLNDNILIKIREMRESFTPVERLVGDYILENTEEIPHLSIKELAQSSKTSDASVLRFCKTMGYSGYRNFIVSISASLGSSRDEDARTQYTDIRPGDDLSTIISNISLNKIKSIEDTPQPFLNMQHLTFFLILILYSQMKRKRIMMR